MKEILQTNRLILRELTIEDSGFFYELNLNPNVIRYTGDRKFDSIKDARFFLENYNDYKLNGYGRWAVIDKTTKDFLGWCGLKYTKERDETDIGFRFFEQYWNKGYATESAKACLQYGFEKLKLEFVVGKVRTENMASIKVLEKLGLTYKKEFDFDGQKGLIYQIEKANTKKLHYL
ncbi:N-acetyltransferase [Flavobacterium crocinum]|uniref:N-acetyltransferase n=1 Tax=Flavobacterium crocinum TaxID=2183896 RepID=A0A2S1YPK6_9FLAO|nr:GNAT family N-acetyltransferase [Flavobacterium crocinum]AWK06040.1 N-acetyltransferase [Flavobacterium crocinum]